MIYLFTPLIYAWIIFFFHLAATYPPTVAFEKCVGVHQPDIINAPFAGCYPGLRQIRLFKDKAKVNRTLVNFWVMIDRYSRLYNRKNQTEPRSKGFSKSGLMKFLCLCLYFMSVRLHDEHWHDSYWEGAWLSSIRNHSYLTKWIILHSHNQHSV